MSRRMTTAEVASKLDVSVSYVYQLRSESLRRDNGFPRPAGFDGVSPLYDEEEIDAFARARAERGPSQRGRRPRRRPTEISTPATFAERLRTAIADGAGLPAIPTQAALIEQLGLNRVTFGERMRGRTRWKPSELEAIAGSLGVDVTDANEVVDRARAARGDQRRRSGGAD